MTRCGDHGLKSRDIGDRRVHLSILVEVVTVANPLV